MKPEEVGPFVAGLRRMVTEFNELPMPVIAALDGAAVGGGLEMALGCDMRTAGKFNTLRIRHRCHYAYDFQMQSVEWKCLYMYFE